MTMTVQEFDDGLLRWGSDMTQWPPTERRAAEELLAASSEARALFADERALDTAVATALAVDPPPHVAAAVRVALDERRQDGILAWLLRPTPLVAGAAAALGIGIAAAILFPVSTALNPDALLLTALGGGLI